MPDPETACHRNADALRFASGDEEVRARLFEEFGEALFKGFGKVAGAVERVLSDTSD